MPKPKSVRAYTASVPALDDEHQEILNACRDLRRALRADAPLGELESIAKTLANRASDHFSREEREMRKGAYSLYPWHRRQHHAALSRANGLARQIHSGDREAARELAQFMTKWMTDHVGLADRLLSAHLRNRRREREVGVS